MERRFVNLVLKVVLNVRKQLLESNAHTVKRDLNFMKIDASDALLIVLDALRMLKTASNAD